jgi:malonyl-CoA/methylmalonyl-CoA synthetase
MNKSNHLYDSIFGQTIDSKKSFLINENGETNYTSFHQMVNQLAHTLKMSGLKTGDRVAVQAQKSNAQIALYAATIKSGGVYLPLNTDYTVNELDYFIQDSEANIIIVDSEIEDAIKKIVKDQSITVLTLNADESGSLTSLSNKQEKSFEAVSRSPEDLAAILYTSGTTGRSKGAQLSHRNLLSNTKVLKDFWKFSKNDTLLHMLPIYHTHGLFVACNLLAYVGGSMIFLSKFDSEQALAWMKRANTMMGVPTFYTRLLSEDRFDKKLTNHMRLFISGSAPLLAETHIEFEKRTGKKIIERYGMTETSMNTSNPYDGPRIAGTVGLPLPGVKLRITDNKGHEVANGKIGTIELRGDNVFSGYWQMPGKTSESFREDGYFITGDMARIDENGYVIIVGRNKDLIITGGLNVYPKEVESLIDEIDDVNESAVIAVPHEDFGEAVVSIVIRKKDSVSEKEIKDHLSEKIAKFKQPKKIIFANALPRNTMGKVQKSELRKKYENLFNN